MAHRNNSLLLILPVFLIRRDNKLWLDNQACNGIRLWLENFEAVTVAAVLNPELHGEQGLSDIGVIQDQHRLKIITLPFSYTPRSFFREYRKTMGLIDTLIDNHRYLSFAIGGFWGDWGSYACLRAAHKMRTFSVWTDRVESDIIQLWSKDKKGIKRFYYYVLSRLSHWLNSYAIRKSSLGLFHGSDCYETYSPLLPRAFCVHDIHLSAQYQITREELDEKINGIDRPGPVRIIYAGRVDTMKGPDDWVQVMSNLINEGIDIDAKWAGEGELKERLEGKIQALGFSNKISFVGLISDRDVLLKLIKESDLFIFCHKTQESPRCLIEALISGCPIVGYASSYPKDLVSRFGGGVFVEKNNVKELTERVSGIIRDREYRKMLTSEAAASGRQYNDSAVFRHRSELIKKYL